MSKGNKLKRMKNRDQNNNKKHMRKLKDQIKNKQNFHEMIKTKIKKIKRIRIIFF